MSFDNPNPYSSPPHDASLPPLPQQQSPQEASINQLSTISMITGILSLVTSMISACCSLFGLIALPMAIVGLVTGLMAQSSIKKNQVGQQHGGKALAGIITSAITLALAVLGIILLIVFIVIAAVSDPQFQP